MRFINRFLLAFLIILAVSLIMPRPSNAVLPVLWGPAGSDPTTGRLDPTAIPNRSNTPYTYTNVNNEGYDIVLSITRQNANGGGLYPGTTDQWAWWFEGATTSYPKSIVSFRFYETGTTNPYAVTGINFSLQDAEYGERFSNFGYWDPTGTKYLTPFSNSSIFDFAYSPVFYNSGYTVDTNAPYASGTQQGKWMSFDLSEMAISGFTFESYRIGTQYGSVIMTDLVPGNPAVVPEPSTLALLSAAPGLLWFRRRRK